MAQLPQPSPRFDDPPVVETVLGVHFRPQPGFTVVQRVLFWSTLRAAFPKVEEKPTADEVREEFGDDLSRIGREIRWQISDQPTSPRLWAKSEDGRHTIQIQQDALFVNWERDQESPRPYLPYADRRRDFEEKLQRLDQFLRETQVGSVLPTTCFVTYINHVEYESAAEFPSLLQRVLTVWRNDTSDGWLPPVERATVRFSFAMPDQHGRLHVGVVPGVRHRDKRRILRIDLTARGAPAESTLSAALDWIDLGHDWVVRGFASITLPEMHAVWGRTQ